MIFEEITLNKNAWHAKLMTLTWGWDVKDFPSFCPYFWITLFNMIISPLVGLWILIKYMLKQFKKPLTKFGNLIDAKIFAPIGDVMDKADAKRRHKREIESKEKRKKFVAKQVALVKELFKDETKKAALLSGQTVDGVNRWNLPYEASSLISSEVDRLHDKKETHLIVKSNDLAEKYKLDLAKLKEKADALERKRKADFNMKITKITDILIPLIRGLGYLCAAVVACFLIYFVGGALVGFIKFIWINFTLMNLLRVISTVLIVLSVIAIAWYFIFIHEWEIKVNINLSTKCKAFTEKVDRKFKDLIIIATIFKQKNCPAIVWEEDTED